MNNLVQIKDLGRLVTPDEYLVACTKTAISVELLFKTLDMESADAIMRILIEGLAEYTNMEVVAVLEHVTKCMNQMTFAGFFRSKQFLELIEQTLRDGEPTEESYDGFFTYVVDNSQEAIQNVPPPGTLLN